MKSEEKEVEMQDSTLGSEGPNGSSLMNKLDIGIYFLNNVTHKLSMLILFGIMCLTSVDVIGRNFLGTPITGAYELTGLGLVIIVFFSLGMTQLKNEHITIDFLTSKFPEKVQHLLHALMSFIVLVLLFLTSWQLFEYAKRFSNQTSGDLGLPMYIFAILASIGVLFFALTILLSMFKSVLKVVQKNES
ncbi:TRAP transporter small permease [Halalkalibacterium ligniniphilum]|uniref:TRAP transporter small permease n=1 Tax=Halalkalibacterium ligniniphilum TaxID=1134413 RepID=UPI00034572A6|nr:TRAP transporter small permease [Halalkalibacterium ligniniphilum]